MWTRLRQNLRSGFCADVPRILRSTTTSKNMSVSISSLPPELLLSIFMFLPGHSAPTLKRPRRRGSHQKDGASRGLGFLVAAHVSVLWRTIILSSQRAIPIECVRLRDIKLDLSVFPSLPISLYIDNVRWQRDEETFKATDLALKSASNRITAVRVATNAGAWRRSPVAHPHATMRDLIASMHTPVLEELDISITHGASERTTLPLALPKSALKSLRTVQLQQCSLRSTDYEVGLALQQLGMERCTVSWMDMFANNNFYCAALRHLEIKGHTLTSVDAQKNLCLRALKSLKLDGKMEDVEGALDRLIVPSSVDMHLTCRADVSPPPDSSTLFALLSAHLAPIHAAGEYFTTVACSVTTKGGQVCCSNPYGSANVLAAHSKLAVEFVLNDRIPAQNREQLLSPNRKQQPMPSAFVKTCMAETVRISPLGTRANLEGSRARPHRTLSLKDTTETWVQCENINGVRMSGLSVLKLHIQAALHLRGIIRSGYFVRLEHLRVLRLYEDTLDDFEILPQMHLPALEELSLKGPLENVSIALSRLHVPVSTRLHIEYSAGDHLRTKLFPFLAPLTVHYASARASGDYFTDIRLNMFSTFWGQIICSVPNFGARVLDARTLIDISFKELPAKDTNPDTTTRNRPLDFADKAAAAILTAIPRKARGVVAGHQTLRVEDNITGHSGTFNWMIIAQSLRTLTALDMTWYAAVRLRKHLQNGDGGNTAFKWSCLRYIAVFQWPQKRETSGYRFRVRSSDDGGGDDNASHPIGDVSFAYVYQLAKDIFGLSRGEDALQVDYVLQ